MADSASKMENALRGIVSRQNRYLKSFFEQRANIDFGSFSTKSTGLNSWLTSASVRKQPNCRVATK
jgi:hypothetical protein